MKKNIGTGIDQSWKMNDESIFAELGKLNVRNRCMGLKKDGKHCRTRLTKNQYLFCCEAHKPLNRDIMEDGCFCCTEKLVNHKEVLYFRCRHAVHKSCYYEWMKTSENEVAICMLCRTPVFQSSSKKYVQNEDGVWVYEETLNMHEKILYVDPTPDKDKPINIITAAMESFAKREGSGQ